MKTVKFPDFPDTTDIKKDDIDWISTSIEEVYKLGMLADYKPNIPYRISGFVITYINELVTVTPGVILYNGELFVYQGIVDFAFTNSPIDLSSIAFQIKSIDDPLDNHFITNTSTPFVVRKDYNLELQEVGVTNTFVANSIEDYKSEGNFTMINGWATGAVGYGAGNLRYTKIGKTVFIVGDLDNQGATNDNIAVVPEDIRTTTVRVISGSGVNGPVSILLTPSGSLQQLTAQPVEQSSFSTSYTID